MQRLIVLAGAVLTAWLPLYFILPTDMPVNNDMNAYVGGAAALRNGHGYRYEQYINLPRIGMYPPAFSALLSLSWQEGEPIGAFIKRLEITNWVVAGIALLLLAACLYFSDWPAWAAATLILAFGTSNGLVLLTTSLTSDVCFAAGSFLMALMLTFYRPDRGVTAWWVGMGLLTACLYLFKTAALAYIAGLGLFGLFLGDLRRWQRLVCFCLPTSFVIVAWFLYTRGIPTYTTYFGTRIAEMGGLPGYLWNVVKQLGLYLSGDWFVEALLNVPAQIGRAKLVAGTGSIAWILEKLRLVLGLVFTVFIFRGIRQGPKTQGERASLFILAVVGVQFVLWPFYLGSRSAIALIPLFMGWLWRGLPNQATKIAIAIFLGLNVAGNAWLSEKFLRAQVEDAPRSLADLKQAAAWINETAGPGASVAAGRDVPIAHLAEFLGRRLLANESPILGPGYPDVFPAAQNNQWADYVVADLGFIGVTAEAKKLRVHRVFGRWTVASPIH